MRYHGNEALSACAPLCICPPNFPPTGKITDSPPRVNFSSFYSMKYSITHVSIPFSGKNDGSVKGVRYFKCRSRHGIFVRHDKLTMDKKRRRMSQTSGTLKGGNAAQQRKSSGANTQPSSGTLKKSNSGSIKKK